MYVFISYMYVHCMYVFYIRVLARILYTRSRIHTYTYIYVCSLYVFHIRVFVRSRVRIYVCICVYVHVYMSKTHMQILLHAKTNTGKLCLYACCLCIYVFYVCMYVCMFILCMVSTDTFSATSGYVCRYLYIHTNTDRGVTIMHTYMYTCMHA